MKTKGKLINSLPIVAVRDSVVFPHTDSILSFGRPKSVAAITTALAKDKVIAIFTQKNARIKDPSFSDLYSVGTIATITQRISTEGDIHAMVRGQARIKLEKGISRSQYLVGNVAELVEEEVATDETQAYAEKLAELFKKAINLGKSVEITSVMKLISGDVEPMEIADSVAALLDVKTAVKQELLETTSVKARLKRIIELLSHEINVLDLERVISTKTQKRFEKQMRKAMLREKKKTIEEELGEEDENNEDEISEYRSKIKEAKMPLLARRKALKEVKRLSKLSSFNPEGSYIRNWLDWIVEMPWSKASTSNVSITKAKKQLNDDHYGLDKVKERILEYLAVMKLKKENQKRYSKKQKAVEQNSHPTILCFIGPPGVGKTSIGRSIAKAIGREFVRVSLGGIRDEAEIRGHRRTYVGALPGRIIQGIKDAGTKNPVFMLDEIDKIGVDFRGDPSSALLEALDPEQNREFSDHYLEVAFDLSDVFFIATGNVLDTIPHALRDRMEVINFPGYTEEEKHHIANKFLWPKQLGIHGLTAKRIRVNKTSMLEIIGRYTREAGVRNLERNLATLCRKIARLVAEKKKFPLSIKVTDVHKFLGPRKFSSLIAEKKNEKGVATGLSVTSTGGEIILIEVAFMPGKGKLTLTGQLGDVMKESAKAAFTWSKSHWQILGLKRDFANKIDVHIHVPEGGVPKDGPSAGIAMTTALVSALTGIKVRRDVGMTGEVTLRGRVLEIGGVKQKILAAHRAGLKTIVLPKDNKKDLVEDVPKNVKRDLKFVFVEGMDEVLPIALTRWQKTKTKKRKTPRRQPYLIASYS